MSNVKGVTFRSDFSAANLKYFSCAQKAESKEQAQTSSVMSLPKHYYQPVGISFGISLGTNFGSVLKKPSGSLRKNYGPEVNKAADEADAAANHIKNLYKLRENIADKDIKAYISAVANMYLMMLKERDLTTYLHTVNVSNYLEVFAESLLKEGESNPEVHPSYCKLIPERMRIIGLLHDIGKLDTPLEILNCDDEYTPEQFNIMKDHPAVGAERILGLEDKIGEKLMPKDDIDSEYKKMFEKKVVNYCKQFFDTAVLAVLFHHTRFDGLAHKRSYICGPNHEITDDFIEKIHARCKNNLNFNTCFDKDGNVIVVGKKLPLRARMINIVDIYDALSSKRPYKEPFTQEKVCEILMQNAEDGKLDPELVEKFIEIVPNLPQAVKS